MFGSIFSSKWMVKIISSLQGEGFLSDDGINKKMGWDSSVGLGFSPAANDLHVTRVLCPSDTVITKLAFLLTANSGSKSIVTGIYADNGANHAGALLEQSDEVILSLPEHFNGLKFFDLRNPLSLQGGVYYWISWHCNATTSQDYGINLPASTFQQFRSIAYNSEMPSVFGTETAVSGGMFGSAWGK